MISLFFVAVLGDRCDPDLRSDESHAEDNSYPFADVPAVESNEGYVDSPWYGRCAETHEFCDKGPPK